MLEIPLHETSCKACLAGSPRINVEKMQLLHRQIPHWRIIDVNGVLQLQRHFEFNNFVEAMGFAQQITDLAEACDHHPALLVEWGKCQVSWWTHKIHGLHENDFIMAAKCDEKRLH